MSPIPSVSINAAFRSSTKTEAYIFMNNEYALLNYGPGTTTDKVLNGGRVFCISDGFLFLAGTPFGEHGIDCAFDTDRNEAYIFSGNLCAYRGGQYGALNYVSKTLYTNAAIRNEWRSLAGTIFESGVDAAFASHVPNRAYVFKGDQCATINFVPDSTDDDYMVGGARELISYFPSVGGVLARKNGIWGKA